MELLAVLVVLAALAAFDVLALRFGADSRSPDDRRPNWW